MFNRFRRQPRWGLSLQPSGYAVAEFLPARKAQWRLGRQLHGAPSDWSSWDELARLTAALSEAKVQWGLTAADLELAWGDQDIQQATLSLPSWMTTDDADSALSQAWAEAWQTDEAWALDAVPLQAPLDGEAGDGLQAYRVYGMRQAHLDALTVAVEALGLRLVRVQPRSLALYHGMQLALEDRAPQWLFELSKTALVAMGPNALGDWVSERWDLQAHAQDLGAGASGLAVTHGDGSPWWAAEVLESLQTFVEAQTQGRLWASMSWAVVGVAGSWQDALEQSLTVLWQRLPNVDEVRWVDGREWPPGLAAWGAVWPSVEEVA